MASRIGFALLKVPSSPPHIKLRVPALAPPTPPETGASRNGICLASACSATPRAVSGEMVDESITKVPSGRDASKPSSPRYTASTCLPAGSMVITHSAPLAASWAVSAVFAPSETSAATASFDRSNTVTSCPAFTRLLAIGPPMLPRPIKVIVAIIIPLFLYSVM